MRKLIGVNTIYRDFYKDALFDPNAYSLSENLYVPALRLKEMVARGGYEIHTMDCVNMKECEYLIFKDIANDSILTVNSIVKLGKYILKRKWRTDFFAKAVRLGLREKMYLIVQEPEVVNPPGHDKRYYQYFNRILTWNDEAVDGIKVFKYRIPQVKPAQMPFLEFNRKKLSVLIASDKKSRHPKELYSLRRRWICFAQERRLEFDLFGFGWNPDEFSCYRGSVACKLATLSQYRFCICFENSCEGKGYITEKIFDCFFAGCVPVYLGAENILDFVPENAFIDFRKFRDFGELADYLTALGKEEYDALIAAARSFLESRQFRDFGVEEYLRNIDAIFFNDLFMKERN